jgi:hypothetical protein
VFHFPAVTRQVSISLDYTDAKIGVAEQLVNSLA